MINLTPAEWVGYLTVDDRIRIIKLTGEVTVGSVVEFALPSERVHRLPLPLSSGAEGSVQGTVLARGEAIRLSGRPGGSVFAGTCETNSGAGSFELRRVDVWDLTAYRRLSRQFEFGGRRIAIHVNGDEWVGSPVLFYAEDDRFVRLYPDDGCHLLSEQGEVFTLSDDRASIVAFATASRPEVLTPVSSLPGWVDEEVTIDGPGGRLAGTLMKPLGPGPHPAAVLIHGAAGGLRDLYRAFAEQFVRCGVAALVYDRRGWGESTGDSDPTFSEKADDASAWLDCLRTRPDIAADRVGVWGYSNGSWVAPLVAARNPHTAFVCVIGASGTTAVETEIHRRAFDLREQGVPAEQIGWVREMWRLIYDLLLSRAPSAEHEQRFDELAQLVHASPELAGITVQEYAKQSPFLGSIPPYASYADAVADMPNHSAGTDEWTCDPVDSYRNITVPVLYLVGLEDSNLPPIESSSRVARALQEAGNPNATLVLFPNTGHGLNVGRPDAIGMNDEEAAYRMHDFRFAGGYLELIQKWVDTKIKQRPTLS